MEGEFDIIDRCIDLTVEVIEIAKRLKQTGHYIIADQVVRSTGSVGANVAEAQSSRSKTEFESTNNIALKETRETIYWLAVIKRINVVNEEKIDNLRKESSEIANIIATIILNSKNNRKKKKRRI